MEPLHHFLNSVHHTYWAVQVLIVLIFTLIIGRIITKILGKLQRKFKKTQNIWDDAFIKSVKSPLSFLIFSVGLAFCAEIIYEESTIALFSIASSLKRLVVIGAIGWFLLKFVKESEKYILAKGSRFTIDRTSVHAISSISTALIVIAIGLVTLQTLGFKIGGILALGGIGGIAIGFAAKDLLSNFFGGLIIYFDKPFKLGDWVRSPDKEIEGTVIKIGWRQTQIRTFDHRPLYVPNSVFSTIVVENPSRMTNRRIYETIGIRYDDISKLEKIVLEVRKMLNSNEEIDQDQTIIVNLTTFGDSSVDFFIYASTTTTNWIKFHQVKQDILLQVAKIVDENGAEIAFPTSNVNLTGEVSALVKNS